MALTPISNIKDIEKPHASIIFVTPEMAERWLGRNKVNRNIRNDRVNKYAGDMRAGNWQLTGEAIKFNSNGEMIDGQHRCWAIIESGCTVAMFVVRGLDVNTQIVLDSGSARTAADNLHMAGYKNAHLVASIARRKISMNNFNNVTNSEVHAFVNNNPQITEAAALAARYANRCDMIPSTVGLAAWLIADAHDWDTADEFFNAAAEKVGLSLGDPVLAMTSFFSAERRARRRLSLEAQLSVVIRAFNYRHRGKSLKLIKVASMAGGLIPIPAVEL